MKYIYKLILVLVCFLIVLNYNKYDIIKEKKNVGGNLIKNINNKTQYFKIKESSNQDKIIILDDTSTKTKLVNDDKKNTDIPHNSIWEIKSIDVGYSILNTSISTPFTLAYNIIEDKYEKNKNIVIPSIIEYKMKLVRNKNVFNIYFADFKSIKDKSKNELQYLVIDNDNDNILIAKSEKEINDSKNNPIPYVKGEFIIEPYKLNLFKKNNETISHYENFVNHFNYEIFNLMFSINFKHISAPEIYEYKNNNKLTNNSNRYNIYPINWIAGPNKSPDNTRGKFKGDGKIDSRNKNLYEGVNQQLIICDRYYKINNFTNISDKYKEIFSNSTSKASKLIDKNNLIALWNITYNDTDGTYKIFNKFHSGYSILKNIIKNSKAFFEGSNYMNVNDDKDLIITNENIYLEELPDMKDHYNLLFNLIVNGVSEKMYISTSNWGGILVARKVTDRFTMSIKKQNAFIIKLNEEDTRTIKEINIKKTLLGLTNEEMNEIIPGSVALDGGGKNIYPKINDGILRDYINNILYTKYYNNLQFSTKDKYINYIEQNNTYLTKKLGGTNPIMLNNINKILDRTHNVQNTIEYIQYIFNIKKYKSPIYDNNPIGEILTIGSNEGNINNFFIKINETIEGSKKYMMIIGFTKVLESKGGGHQRGPGMVRDENIQIPLDKIISNNKGKFPSNINFKLEYKKPYLCVFISYLHKDTDTGVMTEIKGYLDEFGIIKAGITKEIQFEIFFPSYINPWFSVGTNKNINITDNPYGEGFLNEKYRTNKTIQNVKYNSMNNDTIHILSTLENNIKYEKLDKSNNSINFEKNQVLSFKIKLKNFKNLQAPFSYNLFYIQGKNNKMNFALKTPEAQMLAPSKINLKMPGNGIANKYLSPYIKEGGDYEWYDKTNDAVLDWSIEYNIKQSIASNRGTVFIDIKSNITGKYIHSDNSNGEGLVLGDKPSTPAWEVKMDLYYIAFGGGRLQVYLKSTAGNGYLGVNSNGKMKWNKSPIKDWTKFIGFGNGRPRSDLESLHQNQAPQMTWVIECMPMIKMEFGSRGGFYKITNFNSNIDTINDKINKNTNWKGIDKTDEIILDFIPIDNQYALTIHNNNNKLISYSKGIDLSDLYSSTTNKIKINEKHFSDIEISYKVGTSYYTDYNAASIAKWKTTLIYTKIPYYFRNQSDIKSFMGSCGYSKVCPSNFAVGTYKPYNSYVTKTPDWSTWIFKKKNNPDSDEPLYFNDIVTIQIKHIESQVDSYLITCGYSSCSGQLAVSVGRKGDTNDGYWKIVSPEGKTGVIKLTDKIKLLNLWGESWYLNTCGMTSDCGSNPYYQVTAVKKSHGDAGKNRSNWTVIKDISNIADKAQKAADEAARLAKIEAARLAKIAAEAAKRAKIAAAAAAAKRREIALRLKDGQVLYLSKYSRPYPWNMWWPSTNYFCSNGRERGSISWGRQASSFCGWKMFFPDRKSGEDIISGSRVHLYGIKSGKYFHSNHWNGTMSWGGKNISVGWTIHFEGDLRNGTYIHLKSIRNGNYFTTANNRVPSHPMAGYGTLMSRARWGRGSSKYSALKITF